MLANHFMFDDKQRSSYELNQGNSLRLIVHCLKGSKIQDEEQDEQANFRNLQELGCRAGHTNHQVFFWKLLASSHLFVSVSLRNCYDDLTLIASLHNGDSWINHLKNAFFTNFPFAGQCLSLQVLELLT